MINLKEAKLVRRSFDIPCQKIFFPQPPFRTEKVGVSSDTSQDSVPLKKSAALVPAGSLERLCYTKQNLTLINSVIAGNMAMWPHWKGSVQFINNSNHLFNISSFIGLLCPPHPTHVFVAMFALPCIIACVSRLSCLVWFTHPAFLSVSSFADYLWVFHVTPVYL